ncbi:unnamed protein product [Boreogadus saida]
MERLSTQMAQRRQDTLLLNIPHTHTPNRTLRFWASDNCNLRSVPMHRGYRVLPISHLSPRLSYGCRKFVARKLRKKCQASLCTY